jgi:hypothetical protein
MATNVLGWAGAFALVLAASYLIRLGIDSGWLTPARQVGIAAIFGLTLIAAGFFLDASVRRYAGLLPGGGIVILFLTTYGAHLYHSLIGPGAALTATVAICLGSLWLCRRFESDLYALFGIIGSYSAPLLLREMSGSVTDLVIYFSGWSVVFSLFSLWHRKRSFYIFALYLALIVFDISWRQQADAAWLAVLSFQAVQFLVFGFATVMFTIRHSEPLTAREAAAHLPPLVLFYFLQYSLLDSNLPELAPWIAVASALAIALLYRIAKMRSSHDLPGGQLLLWSYVALVLFHAGYIETVPTDWEPWVGLFLAPALAIPAIVRPGQAAAMRPVWLAVSLIFAINYLRILFDPDLDALPAGALLSIAYAGLLYLGYLMARKQSARREVLMALLYLGHISGMAAFLHRISEPIVQSAGWAVFALLWLGLASRWKDRAVGQSSLLIFGAAAAKVMLYDLADASPMARILSLVVMGISLYIGGMLFQRIQGSAEAPI